MGTLQYRLICSKAQFPAPRLLQLEVRSNSTGSQCYALGLAPIETTPFHPFVLIGRALLKMRQDNQLILFSSVQIPLGQIPIVTRFMKGVFNLRPPALKYSATWDVALVLEYISIPWD